MKKIALPDHTILCVVLFLAATTLTTEIVLQTVAQTSLCGVASCRVVGEYIRFGELMLIQAGAVFFWFFFLFLLLAVRSPQIRFWHFTLLACLYGSMAFDGALLGFQFVHLKTYCLICIGVGLILFCVALSCAWWKKSWQVCLLACAVWASGFAASSILVWDSTGGEVAELEDSVLLKTDVAVSGDYPAYHLFFSLHCSHCTDLLTDLSLNNDLLTGNGNWLLHPLDTEKKDVAKLTALTQVAEVQDNVFYAILKTKQLEEDGLPAPEAKIFDMAKKSRAFFTASGYKGIPLLIVQVNPSVTLAFQGNDVILKWLRGQELIERQAVREPEKEAGTTGDN